MRLLARVILVGAVASTLARGAWAQQPRRTPALKPAADSTLAPIVAPATDTSVHPFTPSQIPLEADRSLARALELSAVGAGSQAQELVHGAQQLADSLTHEERIATLVQGHLLTRRGLGDLNITWAARARQIQGWRRTLQSSISQIDTATSELERLGAPWQLTVRAQDSTVSPDVRERTAQVIDELTRVSGVLAARSDTLVRAELQLSNAGGEVAKELQGIAIAQNEMRRDLLRVESPPLWRSLVASGGLSLDGRGGIATAVPELRWFVRGNLGRIVVHLLLTLLGILVVLANRERVRLLAAASESLSDHTGVVARPVAAVMLVSATCALWFYPRAPLAVYDVLIVLIAIPLVLLVPDLVPPDLQPASRIAIGTLVLQRTMAVVSVGTPPFRLLQLALSVAGAWLLWQALQPGGILRHREPRWRLYLRRLAWVLFAAFVVAIGSNVIGNVSLADTINSGVALSLFLALLVFAVTQVADIAASAVIRIGAEESRYLAQRGDRLERVVVSAIRVVSIFLWVVFSLHGFLLWQPAQQALTKLLKASLTLGNVTLSVDLVASFLIVLYIGTQVARLVSGVVELDVMGRMDLRRGVAVTVGSLLRYALIAIAFLLSLAAVGVDLSNLAIVGGALGVGIGFGLQNIVNNFISGLVLAFERPVGIGDTVQVGTNLGEVKEIGIRASVIRTFEGAEVIVPNSELITQDVINWTRSGSRRRIEVAVGVAYGTDPARVIALLADVALKHPEVRGTPRPFGLFTGFGASSLDFVLRAWTESPDWPVVRSDLAVAISAALKEAGIEIPFPQRDLHLKSVDAEALRDLRGEATQA